MTVSSDVTYHMTAWSLSLNPNPSSKNRKWIENENKMKIKWKRKIKIKSTFSNLDNEVCKKNRKKIQKEADTALRKT